MKLLFSCGGSYVSGLEIVELLLMQELSERGHEVHALTSAWNDGDFPARLEKAGISYAEVFSGKISLRRPDWMVDTLRYLPGARRRAKAWVSAVQPDAVVACNRDSTLLLAGTWGRLPVLFHVHELMSPRWTRAVARVVDHFVTVSRFVADSVAACGVDSSRISVVHNGITPAAVAPRQGDPPVIGICGQVAPWKGHEDLIDALGIVASQGVSFRLRVYGRGAEDYVASLKARTVRCGIERHVKWMGFESNLGRMMDALDAVVVPSRTDDPFPTTILEAGARGVPAVGTRRGGIPEMIVDGETGMVVAPESPEALAAALSALLESREQRLVMGNKARERVQNRFLTAHYADRFENVLKAHVCSAPA